MELKTHPYGVPVFVMMLAEVLFSILTDWGLLSGGLGASHRWGSRPSVDYLWVSLWGMAVLKVEL